MNAAYAAEKGSGNRSLFVVGKGWERMYPVSSAFLQAVEADGLYETNWLDVEKFLGSKLKLRPDDQYELINLS